MNALPEALGDSEFIKRTRFFDGEYGDFAKYLPVLSDGSSIQAEAGFTAMAIVDELGLDAAYDLIEGHTDIRNVRLARIASTTRVDDTGISIYGEERFAELYMYWLKDRLQYEIEHSGCEEEEDLEVQVRQ